MRSYCGMQFCLQFTRNAYYNATSFATQMTRPITQPITMQPTQNATSYVLYSFNLSVAFTHNADSFALLLKMQIMIYS